MSWQRLKRMVRHECKGRPAHRQKAMRQRFNETVLSGAPEVTRELRAYVLMGPGPLTGGYGRPPPSTKKKAAVVYGLVQGGRKKQDGKVSKQEVRARSTALRGSRSQQ